MKIRFFDFDLEESVVARVIYRKEPHYTTRRGVILDGVFCAELSTFLKAFNVSALVERTPYYRIDAYFNEYSLWILEINASFVDGWGTALNLARASGIAIDPQKLAFPKRFDCCSYVYQPELALFIDELERRGISGNVIWDGWRENVYHTEPVYMYGRVGWRDRVNVLPYDGIRLDNKLHLARASTAWDGKYVRVPRHYWRQVAPWDEVPANAVLKFCDKGGDECKRARQSVLFGKPDGKAPFLRRCYEGEVLLAQDFVTPTVQDNGRCQLVILAIGTEPITGYVQYGRTLIINDNSEHGPLRIG